jgi:hypothetical protein
MHHRPHGRLAVIAFAATTLLAACAGSEATAPAADAVVPAATTNAGVRLTATLTGTAAFPAAKGKADWRSNGARRELQMEVENLAPGTRVGFLIGGVPAGGATADALGKASLKRSTQLGQPVPVSVAGQPVEARARSGQTIATGSF